MGPLQKANIQSLVPPNQN